MKFLTCLAAVFLAAPLFAADTPAERERKVRVALALAEAPTKVVAQPSPAPPATVRVKIDWLGDDPAPVAAKSPACTCTDCKCKNCPTDCVHSKVTAKVEPVRYQTVKQCVTYFDRFGRPFTQCEDVLVQVK